MLATLEIVVWMPSFVPAELSQQVLEFNTSFYAIDIKYVLEANYQT